MDRGSRWRLRIFENNFWTFSTQRLEGKAEPGAMLNDGDNGTKILKVSATACKYAALEIETSAYENSQE
jgi:hypothetical protein